MALGGATRKRDGILVDSFNAPAVVLGRGQSSGLLLPSGKPFTIAMLFSRVQAPFVAVPDPQSVIGAADRLNKAVSVSVSRRLSRLSAHIPQQHMALAGKPTSFTEIDLSRRTIFSR